MQPEQLERLIADPSLWETGVEELLRFCGPVQMTKPAFATEDVTIHGVTVPKGKMVLPLLAVGNFDPDIFDHPELLDTAPCLE